MSGRPASFARVPSLLLLVCLCCPGLTSAAPQVVGVTTGAIAGTVADHTGAALPGVDVTLSGDALLGPRATTTSEDGAYRFVALPPGEYVVSFDRDGFRAAVSDPVYVAIGFTATVDAVLQIDGVAEHVMVSPRSSAVDKHATAIGVVFDARQLASLPGSRSMFALLSATPGMQVTRFEVGGGSGEAGGPYGAYGIRGHNRPMVEGIAVTGIFPVSFSLNYGSFEEVSVGTAAYSPEWPAAGAQMQFVSKSGGNRYHGTLYGDYEHRDWQSTNIDAAQSRRSAGAGELPLTPDDNRVWKYHDLNADIGGYLRRDTAWWYSSVRSQDVQVRHVNFPVKPGRTRLAAYTGKVTYRFLPAHTAIAFVQTSRNRQPNAFDPFGPAGGLPLTAATAFHETEDSTSTQRAAGVVWKTEWNGVVGDRVFVEVRGGEFDAHRPLGPNGGLPRFEDVETLLVTGGTRERDQATRRSQLYATASHFIDRGVGSHHFKFGAEVVEIFNTDAARRPFPGGALHVLRQGTPTEVYLFLTPSESSSGVFSTAAHAGDTWRVHRRLTLNLGARLDRHRVFLPEQSHPRGGPDGQPITFAAVGNVVAWNVFAPRLGAVVDLDGDGKTLAKLGFSRYWTTPADLGPNVNPNAAEWWRRHQWTDSNGDGLWNPGEEGLLRGRRGGFAVESIDPALRPWWIDEIATSIEREFPSSLALRSGVVWRGERRRYGRQDAARPFDAFNQPVTIVDPGADAVLGTPDDEQLLVHGLDPRLLREPVRNVVRNAPGRGSRYVTWELMASRRFSGWWSLAAGFAHTWITEHANAYSGQAVRQNLFPLTPNDLINTSSGGRHEFRTWTATASGTFLAPFDVQVTPLVRHQSGQPFGRTLVGELNYATIRVLAEPIGTRRMDNVTLVDVRVERGLRVRKGRLAAFVDVFNLFNANPEQNVNWSWGPIFRQPLVIVSPRILRAGLKAGW